ncbi:MAG: hypothetical protein C3F02_01915 [Parcubacteria group bacterium]|nr:MAG: hypothetical protein C3F02_01915 [Parcubacteria group bacterium]
MKLIKNCYYFLLLAWPLSLRAQNDALINLNASAEGTGLITDKSPAGIIALIINSLLALLGTAFIVLIILGGFKWMTSQGNREMIDEARKTITSATIGLVIVLASYMIVRFVIDALTGATLNSGGSEASG